MPHSVAPDAVVQPQTTPGEARAAPAPDRFVGFAFAAGDLLVETDLDGTIGFATGAFQSRLGVNAAVYFGRPVTSLFQASDSALLAMAMASALSRGRIAPLVMHLANAALSPVSVSALLMPQTDAGHPARLCFSIGPVPRMPGSHLPGSHLPGPNSTENEDDPARCLDRAGFMHLAEEALRSGRGGGLGLVDIPGCDASARTMAEPDRLRLAEAVRKILQDVAPGAAAGQLAEGRFGVVTQADIDMDVVVCRLEMLLRSDGAKGAGRMSTAALRLETGDMPQSTGVRALRYALGRFANGRASPGQAIGGPDGLARIVANARAQATTLQATLAEGRFRLLYQPVVRLADRSLHHFEALIRPIAVPGQPKQSIEEFVTFAEMVGLSEHLDWAVLQTALDALAASPTGAVAVNMSGLSMQSAAYRARLLRHLDGHEAVAARRLLVELTETAEIHDLAGAAAGMEALRAAGVPVCLDDFGAGAATFRYLRAFNVDFVKIDGAYVRSAIGSPRDCAMVTSMVELAGSVDAKVIAEAIETEEQAALMMSIGVDYGQGWLFGRPGLLPGTL